MRLNTNATLFTLFPLSLLTSAQPFIPRNLESPVRRATYSVVLVDGGPSTTAGDGETTIIETVTDSPTAKTIISTQTISGSDTVLITVTPSQATATVTATGYSIINVNSPPTVTVEIPAAPAPPSTITVSASSTPSISKSASASTPISSISTLSTSSTTPTASESTSSTSWATVSPTTASTTPLRTFTTIQISNSTSYTATITPLTLLSSSFVATTTPLITSTTTKSYDDGQWHTIYPAWSNSTASITKPTPTLLPSSVIEAPSNGVYSEGGSEGLGKRITTMLSGLLARFTTV